LDFDSRNSGLLYQFYNTELGGGVLQDVLVVLGINGKGREPLKIVMRTLTPSVALNAVFYID